MEFYIAQVAGILAYLFLLYSFWNNGNNKIIYLQIISCMLFAVNYWFLGAIAGLVIVIIEIFRDYLYTKVKDPMKVFYACTPLFILISLFTYHNLISLFAIAASICDSYTLTKRNKKVVILGILTYILWFIYDLNYSSYGTLLGEILLIISNVIVLIKYRVAYIRSDKIKFSRGLYLDDTNIKIIKKLDSSNYNYEYIDDEELNKHILMNKNVDYISIYDGSNLIGYINFIYINRRTYRYIKKANEFVDINTKSIKKKNKFFTNYVNINAITIKNNYQNDKTIELVSKEIKKYLEIQSKIYNIKGIVSVALSEFEHNVFDKLHFKSTDDETNKFHVYYKEKQKSA